MKLIYKIPQWGLPLLIFLSLVIFLWCGLYRDPHVIPSPLINKPLPVAVMEKQNFIGQVTLLNVFATWCLSCHTEHPILMDIARSKVVALYGLDYKDDPVAAAAWLTEYGNPYQKIVNDPQGQLAITLGVYGNPETFIIDQKGIIRDKYTGPITKETWKKTLLPEIQRLKNL